jgi:MraZ protein
VYFGETAINLDAKGRLAMPMRYRDAIQEQCNGRLVLTYSAFDSGALYLYPEQEWERVRDEVMGLSTFNPGHRSLQRKLVGSASAVEPDGNGRIQLPQTLRQVAGLEKRVVLLGMGSRFEIWNETILNQKRTEEERSLDEAASEEMTRLVL